MKMLAALVIFWSSPAGMHSQAIDMQSMDGCRAEKKRMQEEFAKVGGPPPGFGFWLVCVEKQ